MAFLWIYSGCQKHAPFRDRFFLQPLIPAFRISEIILKSAIPALAAPMMIKDKSAL
jgi:hypothetical protein